MRVLDERVGQPREHALVQGRERVRVLDLQPVAALEVDGEHGTGVRERRHRLVGPRLVRVELEAQSRIAFEPAQHLRHDVGVAHPERVHVRDGPRLASQHLVQRSARLREREVERRRLVAPVAAAADHVAELGLAARPLLERVEVRAERAERPLAGERQVGALRLEEQRDVLAEPLLPGTARRTSRDE